MSSIYRALLHLYPTAYRLKYGKEMIDVFRDSRADHAKRGVGGRAVFWVREVKGLLAGSLREHVQNITSLHDPSQLFSGRLTYGRNSVPQGHRHTDGDHPVVAVVMAIEKATAISESRYPVGGPHYGPIQPEHFTFLPTCLLIVLFACVTGAMGWRSFSRCIVREYNGWPTLIPPEIVLRAVGCEQRLPGSSHEQKQETHQVSQSQADSLRPFASSGSGRSPMRL